MNRETWLATLADKLRPGFARADAPLPDKLHISCGWPTHKALATASSKSRTLGQCFSPACSADQTTEIFVTPAVADQEQVAAILVHELCHAALAEEHPAAGHGPIFRALATKMGLTGKMRETVAAPHLRERLNKLMLGMPEYPHATVDFTPDAKKQTTRMIKLTCPDCDYTIRTTRQWIETGLPTCHCGAEFAEPDDGEGQTLVQVLRRSDRKRAKRK